MSDIVPVECRSCGARASGVRTEFGSLVVPGREECPRCGSSDLVEATNGGEVASESKTPAGAEIDPETGTRTED